MDRRSWTLLWVLAAIWGSSYLFIKVGLRDLDSEMIAWARVALAALVLVPLARARGAFRGLGSSLPLLAALAAIQAAGPFLLIALGEQEISSSLTGILVASTPIFTALLAIRVDHEERAQGLRLVGVATGVVGVVILLGLDLGGSGAALLGGLAIILASLGYAIGGFIVKHRFREVQPIGVAAGVMVASSVLLLPLVLFHLPSAVPGLEEAASVIALGVLGTGIAFAIFYELMTTVGPARTFIVTYLAPAFAVVYGAALLDEVITVVTIAGLALIVGGSYLAAEGRLPGARRPPPVDVPPPPGGEAAAQTDIALRPSPSEAGPER
ncbi:MAG TPA: DMT family transporter [Solirubrobacterales bacterium]